MKKSGRMSITPKGIKFLDEQETFYKIGIYPNGYIWTNSKQLAQSFGQIETISNNINK